MKIGTDIYFEKLIQPYDFCRMCVMITDSDGMKYYIEQLGEKYEGDKACHLWVDNGDRFSMNVIFEHDFLKTQYIIHELEHCKNKILMLAGKRANREDDEADAYLIDYLARVIRQGLKRNKIKLTF